MRPNGPCHQFGQGELFPVLGQWIPFASSSPPVSPLFSKAVSSCSQAGRYPMRGSSSRTRYRRFALLQCRSRTFVFAERMRVAPAQTRISGACARWGSCSSGGILRFAWRLIMAPPEVVDYVVVHELAHLRVPDHSSRFWEEVEDVIPDYRDRRRHPSVSGIVTDSEFQKSQPFFGHSTQGETAAADRLFHPIPCQRP
ncbi:MAG: M48 family metallopeptidase [Bacillus subtilis]|nr:M48 family metallopeptidase [Bacillus subtilis]